MSGASNLFRGAQRPAGRLQVYLYASNSSIFSISEEVQQAIQERRPVVALETTIYTHGFPYPDNLALASSLESLVRANGGVPATIGILEGRARVGLDTEELMRLVSSVKTDKPNLLKISRRDLGFSLGLRTKSGKLFNGGTTISGTMVLAHLAGIKVFGTGGLGGVHRGAENTMDISADLTELGRTPVTVISSGCKAFLDLPRTLEYLETQGVGVATFADGRDGNVDLPAFWTRDSGVPSPVTLKDEVDAARVIHSHHQLGLQSGLFFANPIPDQYSIPLDIMQRAINQAIAEAHAAGIRGAANTPFILDKIKQITSSSVEANRALVEANVVRATKVAQELMKLELDSEKEASPSVHIRLQSQVTGPAAVNYTPNGVSKGVFSLARTSAPTVQPQSSVPKATSIEPALSATEHESANIFVAGIVALDFACDYTPRQTNTSIELRHPELHTSNPSRVTQSLGGVAHNVARAAHLMGGKVRLCSAVGEDLSGKVALEALNMEGLSRSGIKTLSASCDTEEADLDTRTAQYIAVNTTNKDLHLAMADMSILDSPRNSAFISHTLQDFWLPQFQSCKPSHLVLDANWSSQHLHAWIQAGRRANTHITFEPVSNAKSASLFPSSHHPVTGKMNNNALHTFPNPLIDLATPNNHELNAMYNAARASGLFDREDWWAVIDALGLPSSGSRTALSLATSPALVDAGVPQQSIQLLPFIPSICTKLGREGVLLAQLLKADDERLSIGAYAPYILSRCRNGTEGELGVGGVYMRLFPAVEEVPDEEVVSVNGVGDTFTGTLVAGLARKQDAAGAGAGARMEELIDVAQRAAVLTLRSEQSILEVCGYILHWV
ncbi:hypothetical protein K431DRAFT_293462 [Polychaeton citri CBS 116435]|uniref:Carbohydrate kinase PfkB domain-containing protein n=1 Tax=Polychaeton citri CBS 116435 TaxID=1314669 RepID=A0A9P4UR81_9PEZI|nr:hypothetical protein K431DRAFT_293462 [Polychaeton citri CBS 116435]